MNEEQERKEDHCICGAPCSAHIDKVGHIRGAAATGCEQYVHDGEEARASACQCAIEGCTAH